MAVATGVGSWPGASMERALDEIASVLGWVPFLPELPQRGPESGMVARAKGLIRDDVATELFWADVGAWLRTLPASTPPGCSGDSDASEDSGTERDGPTSMLRPTLTCCGPVTLAVAQGVGVDDVAVGLAPALVDVVRDVSRRAGQAITLQLDEPLLDHATPGQLDQLSATVRTLREEGIDVLVHSCATPPPVAGLLRLGVPASVDVSGWSSEVEGTRSALRAWPPGWRAGIVPTSGPIDVDAAATRLRDLVPPDQRRTLAVTPACGLGLATDAVDRLRACVAVADLLVD